MGHHYQGLGEHRGQRLLACPFSVGREASKDFQLQITQMDADSPRRKVSKRASRASVDWDYLRAPAAEDSFTVHAVTGDAEYGLVGFVMLAAMGLLPATHRSHCRRGAWAIIKETWL
jgi:hypothetical protein